MSSFTLNRVPAVHNAAGASAHLSRFLADLSAGHRVLLVVDPVLQAGGLIEPIVAGVSTSGEKPEVVVMPAGEPKEAFLIDTINRLTTNAPDAVVCIGGGSTMDAGKLIACLLGGGEGLTSYRLAAQALPRRAVRLICVPTTAGTGSEVTTTAIAAAADGTKYWYWSEELRPDLIILDPELTAGLPAAVTATTGMDALVHAIEAATNANTTNANSMYALRAISLVVQNLETAIQEPSNLNARSAMQEAATFAGIAIDNAGTCIAHNIGHALGSLAGVPHGRAVTIALAATLSWSMEGHEEAFEAAALAMGAPNAKSLPQTFAALAKRVGIDFDLSDYHLNAQALATQMMQPENAAMARSSRRPVGETEFHILASLTLDSAATLAKAQ